MDLTPYVQSLKDDLLASASVGDEDTRRAAAVLAAALAPAARLAMMNAASDLAAEVTGALDGITVDLRLDGPELKVSVSEQAADAGWDAGGWAAGGWDDESASGRGDADAADRPGDDPDGNAATDDLGRAVRDAGDELSRTTLRLVNKLKSQAERAATDQGVSLNTYIQHAVSDAVRSTSRKARWPGGGRQSMHGFVQG
jgi:hypothetical protein